MAHPKDGTPPPDAKPPEAPPTTITVTPEVLNQLINARLAEVLGRNFDEKFEEEYGKMRGKGRPLDPEELVPCRSPSTGSTFTVRLVISRAFPSGRVVELLDYVRPDGTDRHAKDGGLYNGLPEDMNPVPPGEAMKARQFVYMEWLYKSFFAADWNAISGKPGSFLAQWRVPAVTASAAE